MVDHSAPTILLVEDTVDTRLRNFLVLRGYKVFAACNGREAVDVVKQIRPDIVLMDLSLPGLDGLAATEQIRESCDTLTQVPVIALAAHDTYGMREAALDAGCIEYIVRPLDFDRIERTISLMLGA